MNEIEIKINNKTINVERGITLEKLSKQYQGDYKYEIILAKVDGIYKELT